MKKAEVFISHIIFPWETSSDVNIREDREKQNGGIRWTDEFKSEVRKNIIRYSGMENKALKNSNLNDVYKLTPFHFRNELFKDVVFPIWD